MKNINKPLTPNTKQPIENPFSTEPDPYSTEINESSFAGYYYGENRVDSSTNLELINRQSPYDSLGSNRVPNNLPKINQSSSRVPGGVGSKRIDVAKATIYKAYDVIQQASKITRNLQSQITKLSGNLELLGKESSQKIQELEQRIREPEQQLLEKREDLRLKQEELIALKEAIEQEKERFPQALVNLELKSMENEENLTRANQPIKGLQDNLLRIKEKENELLDIDDETDLASRHDEKATQNVSDLSIKELNDRFRETNANSRSQSNPYTSVKIVTALNKIHNIMKSFDTQGHSQPMWENIWNDHSLQNVNDSRFTLTRGDKEVLARFVLQRSEESVTNNPSDIEKVIHVSKQLIKMVSDWESFYKGLISGKSKTVNLVVSGNPSTSPALIKPSENAKPSLTNML